MAKTGGGSKGGGRKKGRNLVWCAAYRSMQTRERNKAVKIARHLRHHPSDGTAMAAIVQLPAKFVKTARRKFS